MLVVVLQLSFICKDEAFVHVTAICDCQSRRIEGRDMKFTSHLWKCD